MTPTSFEELRFRAKLSQRLAALLCTAAVVATIIKPLIIELSPWLSLAGMGHALIWFTIYRLIGAGRLLEQAPLVLNVTGSAVLLCLLCFTGMANSQFAVVVPLLPLFAMLLGGATLALITAGFWCALIGLDWLLPAVVPSFNDQLDNLHKSAAHSVWLLVSTSVATVFSLYVDRSLSQLKQKLHNQAVTDPLTGLANRRGLREGIVSEFARAGRQQHPIAVLLLDIDHFQAFNDRYGHHNGDLALQQLARTLRTNVRAGQDLVARLGGEEFVVLLSNCDRTGAQAAAMQIHQAVAAMAPLSGSKQAPLSISIGAALLEPPVAQQMSLQQRQIQFDGLLQRAGKALGEGKHRGLSQLVIAP